MPALA